MRLGYGIALATAISVAATVAYGQGQDFSKVEIKTTPLGNNVYMLEGQGGNMVVAVGRDGVIQSMANSHPCTTRLPPQSPKFPAANP